MGAKHLPSRQAWPALAASGKTLTPPPNAPIWPAYRGGRRPPAARSDAEALAASWLPGRAGRLGLRHTDGHRTPCCGTRLLAALAAPVYAGQPDSMAAAHNFLKHSPGANLVTPQAFAHTTRQGCNTRPVSPVNPRTGRPCGPVPPPLPAPTADLFQPATTFRRRRRLAGPCYAPRRPRPASLPCLP